MRLNRNTAILAAVLAVTIIGIFIWQNTGDDTADDTPVADATPTRARLFEEVTTADVSQINVQTILADDDSATDTETETDATPSETIRFALDDGGAWVLAEDSDITSERPVTQETLATAARNLAGLTTADSFESDALASFGLDAPAYIITTTIAGTDYRLRVGDRNPSGTGYYMLLDDDDSTVYLTANTSGIDSVTGLIDTPPFEPIPTPTPAPVLNAPGLVFPELQAAAVNTLTITDNSTGDELVIARGDDGTLTIVSAPDALDGRTADSAALNVAVADFVAVTAVTSTELADLGVVGLAEPAYTLVADTDDAQYTLRVGDQDVTGTRYFALVDDFPQVAEVEAANVNFLINLIDEPPYLPAPAATAEATEAVTEDATQDE
jgi:hypothetical protein